jgi:hypothetical protein
MARKHLYWNFYFTIRSVDKRGDNKTFGGEKIEVQVNGPSGQAQAEVQDKGDGTYHVTYKAIDSGDYKISVLLNGHNIKGSPFTQKIA